MPKIETGIPIPIIIWSDNHWSDPITFETIEQLMSEVGATGAGYGPDNQIYEMQCMMIEPPRPTRKKVLYCWVDEKNRIQFANSKEEAEELM